MNPELKIAPVGPRIGAAMIDFILVNVAGTLMLWPVLKLYDLESKMRLMQSMTDAWDPMLGLPDSPELWSLIMSLLVFSFAALIFLLILIHAYYIYFESTSGQTPGKKLLNLKVVDLDGHKITKQQAVIREALRWYVDAFLITAFVAMAMTVRRQRVGDIAAKTIVVKIPNS